MLYRHWSVYEPMYHSPYVASRVHIWKQNGKQEFHDLLANMGCARRRARRARSTTA